MFLGKWILTAVVVSVGIAIASNDRLCAQNVTITGSNGADGANEVNNPPSSATDGQEGETVIGGLTATEANATLTATGGNGGNGGNALANSSGSPTNGGKGGNASGLAGFGATHPTNVALNVAVNGGAGGNAGGIGVNQSTGGRGGSGGNADSSQGFISALGNLNIGWGANGGAGGASLNGHGGTGGSATFGGAVQTDGNLVLGVVVTSGAGGGTDDGTAGDSGGIIAGGTVYGKSTTGRVNVALTATSGGGGVADRGGNAGEDSSVTLINNVDGDVVDPTQTLTLVQTAITGGGGSATFSGNATSGADARSDLVSIEKSVGNLSLTATATGGGGGNAIAGTAGNGGNAVSAASGVTVGVGVFVATAVGGAGGNAAGRGGDAGVAIAVAGGRSAAPTGAATVNVLATANTPANPQRITGGNGGGIGGGRGSNGSATAVGSADNDNFVNVRAFAVGGAGGNDLRTGGFGGDASVGATGSGAIVNRNLFVISNATAGNGGSVFQTANPNGSAPFPDAIGGIGGNATAISSAYSVLLGQQPVVGNGIMVSQAFALGGAGGGPIGGFPPGAVTVSGGGDGGLAVAHATADSNQMGVVIANAAAFGGQGGIARGQGFAPGFGGQAVSAPPLGGADATGPRAVSAYAVAIGGGLVRSASARPSLAIANSTGTTGLAQVLAVSGASGDLGSEARANASSTDGNIVREVDTHTIAPSGGVTPAGAIPVHVANSNVAIGAFALPGIPNVGPTLILPPAPANAYALGVALPTAVNLNAPFGVATPNIATRFGANNTILGSCTLQLANNGDLVVGQGGYVSAAHFTIDGAQFGPQWNLFVGMSNVQTPQGGPTGFQSTLEFTRPNSATGPIDFMIGSGQPPNYALFNDGVYGLGIASGTIDITFRLAGSSPLENDAIGENFIFGAVRSIFTNGAGNGNIGNAPNFNGPVPNGAGQALNLVLNLGPTTINMDGAVTLGVINFDSPSKYTIAGPHTLTMDGLGGRPMINVDSGSHEISAPLSIAAGNDLGVNGPGTLTISGVQSHGSNSSLTVNSGTVNITSDAGSVGHEVLAVTANSTVNFTGTQHLRSLAIGPNTVVTMNRPNGGGQQVLVTGALSLNATADLDLTNNSMVVHGGADPMGTFLAVEASIANAFDNAQLDGHGIKSSSIADPFATGLGSALNSLLAAAFAPLDSLNGEPAGENDTLVKYTYMGDATLDGVVNDDDVAVVSGFYDNGATSGHHWFEGDFTHDGLVNDDDISILTGNYNPNAPPLSARMLGARYGAKFAAAFEHGLTAQPVPEPGTLLLGSFGLLGFLGIALRRRMLLKKSKRCVVAA